MTSASMTFGRPTRIAMPRATALFTQLTEAVLHGLRRLDQWQLSFQQQEPQTPEDVLAWARRIEGSEPGFAADLRGAALRAMGQQDTMH